MSVYRFHILYAYIHLDLGAMISGLLQIEINNHNSYVYWIILTIILYTAALGELNITNDYMINRMIPVWNKTKRNQREKKGAMPFFHEDEIPFDIIHAKGYCTESEYLSIFVTELHLIWLWVLMTNSLLATMFTIVKKNEPQENCNRSKIQIIRSNMGGEKRQHSHPTEVYLSQSIQFCWKHRKVFAINLINNQMRC